jgi:hypothetical protein
MKIPLESVDLAAGLFKLFNQHQFVRMNVANRILYKKLRKTDRLIRFGWQKHLCKQLNML